MPGPRGPAGDLCHFGDLQASPCQVLPRPQAIATTGRSGRSFLCSWSPDTNSTGNRRGLDHDREPGRQGRIRDLVVVAARPADAVATDQPEHWRDTGKLPARPDEQPPQDTGMIRVTVPEARRLLAASAHRTFHSAWSIWRRHHQARARRHHYQAQLQPAQHDPRDQTGRSQTRTEVLGHPRPPGRPVPARSAEAIQIRHGSPVAISQNPELYQHVSATTEVCAGSKSASLRYSALPGTSTYSSRNCRYFAYRDASPWKAPKTAKASVCRTMWRRQLVDGIGGLG